MSLTLRVKHFQLSVKCKGEKITKVDFRGVSHYSRVLQDPGELIDVDQKGSAYSNCKRGEESEFPVTEHGSLCAPVSV
ncbi:hypothetical protein L798_13122 [Zootermopsis nevadensis]|uniref:Uncharacterized protein n=1 Tax=Zootermopsis nevadensis TaxID=136037 RepID=A0A067QSR8_ZOONE|nr:hypothetical protein L798_13122 [Zootermopsis nevadensis]